VPRNGVTCKTPGTFQIHRLNWKPPDLSASINSTRSAPLRSDSLSLVWLTRSCAPATKGSAFGIRQGSAFGIRKATCGVP
jgi:hypothetical protein